MKRRAYRIIAVMLLALLLIVPAQAADSQLGYVTDTVGILYESEVYELESLSQEISEKYDCGVYTIILEDYTDYTNGQIIDAAADLYHYYDLGLGEDKNAIILVLSMYDRDYVVYTHGDAAETAFSTSSKEDLADYFLDELGSDEWYDGIESYITRSGEYLEAAANGNPGDVTPENVGGAIAFRIVMMILIPLIIALIVVAVLNNKMKSVAMAAEASEYVVGDVDITESYDRFTHTTTTRVKIQSSSSGKSGGGSGVSGKF